MRARRPVAVGDTVTILSEHYQGHWGVVVAASPEDDQYTVSEGSVGQVAPIFSRDELRPAARRRDK